MSLLVRLLLVFIFPTAASAISVADSLYQELKKAKPDTNKVILLNKLCWEYRTSNPSKAYEYSYAAIELGTTLKYDRGLANAWNRLGVVHYRQGNYVEATTALFKALDFWEKLKDKKGKAKTYSNLGNVFSEQKNNEKALEYYLKAVDLLNETGQQDDLSTFYINIGTIYVEQEKLGQARDFFTEALKIARRTGNIGQQAQLLNNLGATLGRMGKFEEALAYHRQALVINEQIPDKAEMANCYLNMGVIYFEMKNTAEAQNCLKQAETFAREVDFKSGLRNIYKMFSKVYEKNGNAEVALLYHKKYAELSDSLLSEENSIRVGELDARYQSVRKERELQQKQAEIEKREISDREKTVYLYIALAGIVVLLIVAGVIITAFLQKQSSNRMLAFQKAEIEKKNTELSLKNKDILDSITYSKRIQDAMLPTAETIATLLPDSFIFFRPRDIVSGDFYWLEKWGDTTLVAAVDCTGHGVPGALMSMVGNNLLSQAANVYGINRPGAMLQRVNKGLQSTLKQHHESFIMNDGMDIALLAIRFDEMKATFAGANNPLWLIRKGELIEFPGSKMALDGQTGEDIRFVDHEITLEKGDLFYLFTDGYADQFGGPAAASGGKKFKYAQLKKLLCSLSHLPMAQQHYHLRNALEQWQGRLEQVDDILVVGIRI